MRKGRKKPVKKPASWLSRIKIGSRDLSAIFSEMKSLARGLILTGVVGGILQGDTVNLSEAIFVFVSGVIVWLAATFLEKVARRKKDR
ncbi:hypothetical protein [Motilimonas eburnea]|uniref:hypothetical protein n=1 Tax=Motilimonas eburnea TaxID=1737488 RepID=UPI001E45634A|nr:hypothetical protein [Motilimonas eburnea]MCE2573854.1 hypothetical protein [Motilimonas eburnea]